MLHLLRPLLDDLLDLVAPHECAACRAAHPRHPPGRTVLCDTCAGLLEAPDELPPGLAAPYLYEGPLVQAILHAKHGEDPAVARALGALLVPAALALVPHVDLVVPVPLHPRRLAHRGFNQSVELARAPARARGVPLAPGCLQRVRDTPSQRGLGRTEREVNLRGAFRLRPAARVQGLHVLLVDDVATTGATLAAARAALEDGGATCQALALARAPLR